jgi:hypothetical protein
VPSNKRPTADLPANRYQQFASATRSQGVSIRQVDSETLQRAVATVVDSGDAILIGRTSDGGALSVRVLSGGATTCWYPTDASELLELFQGLSELT